MGYTNRVGIGLEVLHGDGDREVWGEEQAEAGRRHDSGYPSPLGINDRDGIRTYSNA